MSRTLALKLLPAAAIAAVVRNGERLEIERAMRIPLPTGGDGTARGKAIREALATWKLGRMATVLAAPRSDLTIQNLELPPMPADDLPELVHLQAERDIQLSEDGEGFDFLPLAGDEDHPYRVLGAGLSATQWKTLKATCDASELKVGRIVPEPLGWVELGRNALTERQADALGVFSAIIERQAVVWASRGDALQLIRTVWLPADDNAAADAAALGNELRRTLLSLAQSPDAGAPPRCYYLGDNADEIAGELGATISKPVQATTLAKLVRIDPSFDLAGAGVSLVELAPMAALAAAAGAGKAAPIDLLHPRRRPPAPSKMRTYVLAGAAAVAGVAMIGWQAYQNVQAPLALAATADAERKALEPVLESYKADETKAAAIGEWLGQSTNLLTELDHLSGRLRPEPLASEKFAADQDLVLTRLNVINRQVSFTAAAKSNDAIQPAERRLREGNYRVDRGVVEPKAEGMPGFNVTVFETVERVAPATTTTTTNTAEPPAAAAPAENAPAPAAAKPADAGEVKKPEPAKAEVEQAEQPTEAEKPAAADEPAKSPEPAKASAPVESTEPAAGATP
ncbi:hypothetical protein [Lacipirellula parvula]|uniref:Uncharacterized protein n=1 Tax=Lacipirellula parvula TaxID=2650471 RepID=A0A5K7X7N1_9BACT|nr:hypothetical protein [Lacipirellula parvula]BBO32395.1 hypothetical protein PLANPX_2007 [Lacipirellula parvula]